MKTLESSSLEVESTMDDITILPKPKPILSKTNKRERLTAESNIGGDNDDDGDDDTDEEDHNVDVWNALSMTFRQVQAVLDQNRNLIRQVNENHQSMMPDNLANNIPLIREINGNIFKIISIYSDLSVNFSNVVRERRRLKNGSSVERSDS